MISCLLINVTCNQRGLQASNEIRIAGDVIELGRGAACQIHLPDHRVSLLHATLKRSDDGTLRIEAEPDALISIDGFVERAAVLSPGTRVGIGPYLLTVKPVTDDFDATLLVEMPQSHATGPSAPHSASVTLSALDISRRRYSLWLAIFILLALFLLPMLTRVSPELEKWQATLPVALTELLNPGPLSSGHSAFGTKCSACHQHAFQSVADAACAKCHERIAMHLSANDLIASKSSAVRCAECHASHRGKVDAMKDGLPQCVACHKSFGTSVGDARDFGTRHPPFQLTVPVGKNIVRVPPDAKAIPPDRSGLKFSHQVHLAKNGVSTPTGDTVLTCRDCHKLETAGNHFAPMAMTMTCQQSRCHTLRFAEPVHGVVPHGSEREVMNSLRSFYANWLADSPAENGRECAPETKTGNVVRRTLDCADRLAHKNAASSLFKETGENLECALCHEVTTTERKDVPWKVMPVSINRDWQPKAIFVHAKHDTVDCTQCHDKANSKASEDVALPPIEKCRECHTGTFGASGRVKSNCESCHRFHRVARNPS